MSEEKKFWADASMSKEDMGEVIKLIMDKLGMTPDELADDIETKAMIINSAIKGKGNHVYNVLKKICDKNGYSMNMTIEEK